MAWRVKTGGQPSPWRPEIAALLNWLEPAVPPHMTVRALCDQGLQSPCLWQAIRRQGWHPLPALRPPHDLLDDHRPRGPAGRFVVHEGQYTVTAGQAFSRRKRCGTLIVLWVPGQETPWVVLRDLTFNTDTVLSVKTLKV